MDDAGLQVLIDLHGGDPQDEIANAEYQEIKERVLAEVRSHLIRIPRRLTSDTAREWRSPFL